MFDEFGNFTGAAKLLPCVSKIVSGRCGDLSYLRAPPKTQANGTDECALSSTIRADDHVQLRPWEELCRGVSDKIGELDSNDRARLVLRPGGRISVSDDLLALPRLRDRSEAIRKSLSVTRGRRPFVLKAAAGSFGVVFAD